MRSTEKDRSMASGTRSVEAIGRWRRRQRLSASIRWFGLGVGKGGDGGGVRAQTSQSMVGVVDDGERRWNGEGQPIGVVGRSGEVAMVGRKNQTIEKKLFFLLCYQSVG